MGPGQTRSPLFGHGSFVGPCFGYPSGGAGIVHSAVSIQLLANQDEPRERLATRAETAYSSFMEALAEKLDGRLRHWRPETASRVEEMIAEIIDLADADALDLLPSPAVQQEVLDLLDDSET